MAPEAKLRRERQGVVLENSPEARKMAVGAKKTSPGAKFLNLCENLDVSWPRLGRIRWRLRRNLCFVTHFKSPIKGNLKLLRKGSNFEEKIV
ncbi:hypothetical protein A2U01_0059678, partial [Trifolium medium]|nr:hypothetical protein [Trifolium medium]